MLRESVCVGGRRGPTEGQRQREKNINVRKNQSADCLPSVCELPITQVMCHVYSWEYTGQLTNQLSHSGSLYFINLQQFLHIKLLSKFLYSLILFTEDSMT